MTVRGGSTIFLNPIALRKAKVAYNFGLSECNRVDKSLTKTEVTSVILSFYIISGCR